MSLASPVSKDGFGYVAGELYARASNHNLHRRATLAELREHFASSSSRPAHWYESQLMHYGLRASKVKSTARMRLYDAVNAGGLEVPSHVRTIEAALKKEWDKKDRAVKKMIKSQPSKAVAATGASSATGTAKKTPTKPARKRKAADSPDSNPAAVSSSARDGRPTKKTKTTTAAATEPSKSTSRSAEPRRKQTARCSRGGANPSLSTRQASGNPGPSPGRGPQKRTKQTARRSRPFGHYPSFSNRSAHLADNESSDASDPDSNTNYGYDGDSDHNGYITRSFPGDNGQLPSLGLLNGDYSIRCPYVVDEWPYAAPYGDDFELALALEGSRLWGSFDLGIISGVLFFETRPYRSARSEIPFTWRGRELEGPVIGFNEDRRGWMQFLGGGEIVGEIEYLGTLRFSGARLNGSGLSFVEMKTEWAQYNEDAYDRERVARWR